MTWFFEILKIFLEELLIKYYLIKHLILQKIQNMIFKYGPASRVYNFFDNKSSSSNLKNKKYTHLFKDNIWGADLACMPLIYAIIK